MIVPMLKYSMLVFHREYKHFLEELQEVGVFHVIKKNVETTAEIKEKYKHLNQLDKIIQCLDNRPAKPNPDIVKATPDSNAILNSVIEKQKELELLELKLENLLKELQKANPWGNFSQEILVKLRDADIHLQFFTSSKKNYLEIEKSGLPVEMILEEKNLVYFIVIQKGNIEVEIDAEKINPPASTSSEIEAEIDVIEKQINTINELFDAYAASSIPILNQNKKELIASLEFENVVLNTSVEADQNLMILEGWIPKKEKKKIDSFLEKNKILFFAESATPEDNIPVLLKNNRFSKLFEPIGSMFSLPHYTELDLTVFFAPFFMLFFGFCLGDAGYGLLFIIGAGLYKLKAEKDVKPYLTLIQFLGLATIIFGAVSGTFFGINLIEANFSWTENYRDLFLNPDKMFNLALILGGIQIIFGLFIRAANQIKQYGFSYCLATLGWLIILLGSTAYMILSKLNIIQQNSTIMYILLAFGGFFILFFSDPRINVFARIGKGVWDVYSTVTGIFGDLLSYIRLFALGLSSAILGFVINDIAVQILESSKIIGPLFFVVFLLLGHTLNILISSLGSFVHPMRLTFVEFYKSAGFIGGGEAYKPFSK